MHARELAGSWTSLALLDRLAEGFEEDDAITDLLRRRTFYVVPRLCPDGADFVLETRTRKCRSRFVDLDADDVRESNVVIPVVLTGDGKILAMRWPAEDGDHVVPDDDPRLMLSREDDETENTVYRKTVEGPVANYDGGSVSEVDMRVDFNRNFPDEQWDTFDWIGQCAYPLSEPETKAVAEFLLDRRNVTGVTDLHTGNPAIFYPAAIRESKADHPADVKRFRKIGERGEELTDFPYLAG